MPSPRETVLFDGFVPVNLTFVIDNSTITFDATKPNGSSQVNLAVTMSGHKTVALTADGDPVVGKLTKVHADGKCSVQVLGGVLLPAGNGANVSAGRKIVGALNALSNRGYVRGVAATTGAYVQGTAQDALNGRGLILDGSDPTAVAVIL